MKILIHAQHLSGVGHRVRALELARHFARSHRVVQVDGGRAVPRTEVDVEIERLVLPRIARGPAGLASVDGDLSLPVVLAERRERLVARTAELAPDVLLVEHYPFSKWELEPEIKAAMAAARAANTRVRVVCSLRDVCRRTRHEVADPAVYARRVSVSLREGFDAVIVHADERFTRLEEHFPGADELRVPVFYSGFVSERCRAGNPPKVSANGHAVLSVGGGGGSAAFARRCIEAWKRLHAAGERRTLVVFSGLFWSELELSGVRAATAGGPFLLKPFSPELLDWLAGAELSISRAGYNTCTNLLETRCPALLVPHPKMSDQAFRAARMAELGIAETLPAGIDTPAQLAEAISRTLSRPLRRHDLDLDGAARTERLLEALVAAGPGPSPRSDDRGAARSSHGQVSKA